MYKIFKLSTKQVFKTFVLFLITGALHINSIIAQTNPALSWGTTLDVGSSPSSTCSGVNTTDASNNIYSTGAFSGTVDADPGAGVQLMRAQSTQNDMYIQKFNSNGALQWSKQIKGTGASYVTGKSIVTDGTYIYITGVFTGNTDFDPDDVATANLTNAGGQDVFVLKLTTAGIFVWVKQIGSIGNETGNSLTLDASSNIYITGTFEGSNVDFNPGVPANTLSSNGGKDFYIQKLDASGAYVWAVSAGNSADDIANAITIDGSSNIYITGSFIGTVDMNPSGTITNFTSAGGSDVFILKLSSAAVYVSAKQFGSTGNDYGSSIACDGTNIYTVGNFFGTNVDFDPSAGTNYLTGASTIGNIFISKMNINLTVSVWAEGLGKSGQNITATSVAFDASKNAFVTGSFNGAAMDFDPGAGSVPLSSQASGTNGFVLKLNALDGSYNWVKPLESTGTNTNYSIAIDANGNSLTIGSFAGKLDADPAAPTQYIYNSLLTTDLVMRKLDASGNYVWANGILVGIVSNTKVAVDAAGNTYSAGTFNGTSDFDPSSNTSYMTGNGGTDIYLLKFNSTGTFQWAKQIGGEDNDEINDLTVSTSGKIFITGRFQGAPDFDPGAGSSKLTSTGNFDAFVAKFSTDGDLVWAKGFGSSVITSLDAGIAITIDNQENVYTSGVFESTVDFDPGSGTAMLTSNAYQDVFIQKLDKDGNFEWAKSFGGNIYDRGNDITSSGSFIYVTGEFGGTVNFDASTVLTSLGSSDAYVAKFDATNGSLTWAKQLGNSAASEHGFAIAVDAAGSIFIAGDYMSTVDFDMGTGVHNSTTAGGTDAYIEKISSSGEFVWMKSFGGSLGEVARSMALDAAGNPCIVGSYNSSSTTFNPNTSGKNLSSAGLSDIFITKLNGSTGVDEWTYSIGNTFNDDINCISINSSNKISVTGSHTGSISIDPNGVAPALISNTAGGFFIFQWNLGTAKLPQTITASDISIKYGDVYTSTATSSSGLALTITSSDGSVANTSGNTITALDVTSSPINISYQQAGDANYYAAPDVIVTLAVSKKDLFISTNNVTLAACDPIPTSFPSIYSGFVGTEDASVLDEVPNYNTSATGSPGTYTITVDNPTNYSDNHYNMIISDGTLTITGLEEQAIIGKDILSSDTRSVFNVKPNYSGFEYAWYYTGTKMVILSDTTFSFLHVLPDDSTSNGSIACIITGCGGTTKDTITKAVTINKKPNHVNELEKLTCEINRTNCALNYISKVSIENIFESMNADCSPTGYSDYTASSKLGTLFMGDTYTARVQGGGKKGYFGLWIDYNNDGDFEDAQEYVMANEIPDYDLISPNVSIPNSDGLAGYKRMRVQTRGNAPFKAGEPCTIEVVDGETEDYIIKIESRAALQAPNFITPNNDGQNDLFEIRGIDPSVSNNLFIMDQQGKVVYQKDFYQNTWPEEKVKPGTYYFVFKNGDIEIRSFFEVTF